MYTLFIIIHVIICILIIGAVLLQTSKGGGFGGIFGSSGEVIFSTPSGSSFIRKATIGLAIGFGVTSLMLTVLSKARMYSSVVMEEVQRMGPQSPAPSQPQGQQPAQEQKAPSPAKK
ncbi:MAG: preprotein translocase subunit SecG [Elusimicrobia bacterium]|nr:preprotein translocase subunit SecG [Elusimicrobiota bacterium]